MIRAANFALRMGSKNINHKELFLRACRCEPVQRVPVWIMRQAGRYLPEYQAVREKHSFLEICKTPELAAEVSIQPFERIGVDAIIVFSDILIVAEAMGMPLDVPDSGPVLGDPIRDAAGVARLRGFDPAVTTRFVGDAIRGIVSRVGADVPVLGFAAAPWTLACYMVEGRTRGDVSRAKAMMYAEPRLMRDLLSKIASQTAAYLRAQIDAGAAAVQLFDTWAGELSEEEYEAFELPAIQQVIGELKAGDTPVIYYSKGSAHFLELLGKTGADVISVDWRIPLDAAREALGPRVALQGNRVALQGNIDPRILLTRPELAADAAREAVLKTGGVGHILNLGHGILPNTPVENARAFVLAGQAAPVATGATESKRARTPAATL
jgi:uroporphyrinogen decarboxylase